MADKDEFIVANKATQGCGPAPAKMRSATQPLPPFLSVEYPLTSAYPRLLRLCLIRILGYKANQVRGL